MGVSTVILGAARMSVSSQRSRHGVDNQETFGSINGDNLEFEATVVDPDVRPPFVSTLGDNRGGFTSSNDVTHVSLADPVPARRLREPQLHTPIMTYTIKVMQDTTQDDGGYHADEVTS